MADNVDITPGTGKTVAADDVGGALHQRVKPTWGVDGTGTDVTATTPLPTAIYAGGAAIDLSTGTAGTPAGGVSSIQGVSGMVPVVVAGGGTAGVPAAAVASVQGFGYDVPTTITRPANTTAYTAGDVVGGAIQITALAPAASSIIVTGAQLELDIAAIPSGMTSFRLHLYSVTPPSALADNAAWDLPSGDRASYLGFIDLGAPADLGSTCYCEIANVNKQIKTAGANVFAYLQTNGGFTPAANSEVYKLTLHSVGV